MVRSTGLVFLRKFAIVVALTPLEIEDLRQRLQENADALVALQEIEDCEGDLEDAAIALAIRAGKQPDAADWLESFAKRFRPAICEGEIAAFLRSGKLEAAVDALQAQHTCPRLLLLPVLAYVWKTGIDAFCEPLNLKIDFEP